MYPLHKTPLPSTSGFVLRPTPTFQPIAQNTPPRQLIHTTQMTHKVLKHCQRVHYPVDNGPPWDQQALTAHHLNIHLHSRMYLHNLLHHSHLTQATHPHALNPKEHHNHLPPHSLNNILLMGQILIRPPSLPFQLQRHTNLCPAHHHSTSLSLQMVKE